QFFGGNTGKLVCYVSRGRSHNNMIGCAENLPGIGKQGKQSCIKRYGLKIIGIVMSFQNMFCYCIVAYAPVNVYPIVCKHFCQCCSPASAANNTKLHKKKFELQK